MADRFIPPGVFKGRGPDGETRYVIPSAPGGGGRLQGMHDVIENPAYWVSRTPGQLSIESADAIRMVRDNVKANRKLGEMADWRSLWGKESGRICLFVSCGPSLTESLPEIAGLLKERDKYFTLGINRAFKAVDLDYFVVIDRRCQEDWIDRDTGNTTLIATTSAQPAITGKFEQRYWGESFLAGTDEGNAPLRVGLCISMCDAMLAAYKLGAEEIWLYGADFAMSGTTDGQQYALEKYYFDLPSYVGLGIRPENLREMQPVAGRDGKLGFINYELWAYACYATAMCCMIEESGGVRVRNKSKAGILSWGTE